MLARIACLAAAAVVALPAAQTSSATSTRSPGDTPSVGEIMDRAMARAKAQDDAGAELWFESLVGTTIDNLDEDNRVTKTDTTLHRRYPLEGAVYEELIEQNGEPLDESELKKEQERKDDFRREAREAAASGETLETDDERQVRFDEELMARYRADVAGEEYLRGERCWVIDFEPREGKLPENTRMDKALNGSTGRLYVSQTDHGIMRIEFELREPVSYLWGLVASLRRAEGQLDFVRVEPDVWLPQMFDIRVDIRVFFRTIRRQVIREWVERSRIEPSV